MCSTTKLTYKGHVSIFKRQIECSESYGTLKVKIVSLQFLMVKKVCSSTKVVQVGKMHKQKDKTNWSPINNNACV